jgi:hypothetical protein
VTEPSDAVNAGMAKQNEVRRLALSHKSPPSVRSLVGWLDVACVLRQYWNINVEL